MPLLAVVAVTKKLHRFLVVLEWDPHPRLYLDSFLAFDCLYEGYETVSAHALVLFSVGSAEKRRDRIRHLQDSKLDLDKKTTDFDNSAACSYSEKERRSDFLPSND